MVLVIVGVAFVGVVINIILKNTKPEIAILSSVVAVLIIMSCVLEILSDIITKFMAYVANFGAASGIFSYLCKILGLSYIIEFMVDVAEDSGSKVIADKVAFAGKILMAGVSLPVLFDLIDLLMGFV